MDAIGQIVKDIIDLKIESDNVSDDATFDGLFHWFDWAFKYGIIEVIYKYGKLQGFVEWVRLKEVPTTQQNAIDIIDFQQDGDVLYITQCCVRDDGKRHGVLWKLWHMAKEKNPDCECYCWHEEDTKKLKVYRNIKNVEEVLV